jgi:integrase/recombinase XerC
MEKLLQNFREYLANNPLPSRRRAGASEVTIKGYVQDISIFLRWWKQSLGVDLTIALLRKDPYQLNKKTLQDFLSYLEVQQRYSAATILRYAASLRAFSVFLADANAVQHDPTIGLRLPIKKQSEPKGLDDAQRARFEAVFQTPWLDKVTKRKRSYETLAPQRLSRDKAIAYLMLYAGPRIDEVHSLNLDDVELSQRKGMIHIRKGKNAKERDVNLPLPARESLAKWLKVRGDFPTDNDALFIDLRGSYQRLSVRSMQTMIVEAGKRGQLDRCDPPAQVTPHVLRHTWLYMLRRAGVSAEIRAELAGHSLETTMKYGSPKREEIERAVAALDDAGTI